MRPCAPSSACNGTWLRRGECRRSHLCGFTAGVRSVPLLMQAAAQRCPPGQGGTFSPPPETVMCERAAGLHRKEERVLPCPARQPLVTARSVRRRGARTRPFSRADLVSIVCQARRPVPSPAPVRPERRCSRQDLHWPSSVWNVLQAGILLFLGLDKLRFLLNRHSVRPHQFDRVLECFASSTLVWKGGFLG